MKPRFAKFGALIAAGSLLLTASFSSCKKEKHNNPQMTITEVVSANKDFSVLKSAVLKAGLAETLNGPGPFTVFAPNNKAFAASGISDATISSLSAEQLKAILLYHTVGSKIAASAVPAGPNEAVATAGGGNIYVTRNDKGVFINGWQVIAADVPASNGIIHVIERVLMPPAGNIVAVAQSNEDFSYLVAAVLRASEGSTNVAAVLSSDGPFTVFAPTNQAFKDAGFASIAAIQAADPNTLAAILTYHVVPARVFSSDLSDGQDAVTLNGGTVKIGLSGSATVKGNGNASAAAIKSANVTATNGVVHVIDKVLLP